MGDKTKEFKKCLQTFGYRKLNEEIMAKPLAFLLIYVKVTEEKAVFGLPTDVTNELWSEYEIEFNDYMFEYSDVLSERIASAEYHLIGTTQYWCGKYAF